MPTSAEMRASMCANGSIRANTGATAPPIAPPIVSSGASVPPDVPLPSAIAHDTNLKRPSISSVVPKMRPSSVSAMLS
jgi:hypothetical protein